MSRMHRRCSHISHQHRLAGRPDYLTREAGGLVPVEVKSRSCGKSGPYRGERAQLLAYCLLAEQDLGGAPSLVASCVMPIGALSCATAIRSGKR
jgi:hypothetical protein